MWAPLQAWGLCVLLESLRKGRTGGYSRLEGQDTERGMRCLVAFVVQRERMFVAEGEAG